MEEQALQLEHLLLAIGALAAGFGLPVLTLYIKLRTLNKDKKENIADEAIRRHEIERRLNALEEARVKDTEEHTAIRDTITNSTTHICNQIRDYETAAKEDRRGLHERLNPIEKEIASLSGKVDVLVGQDRARTLMAAEPERR